MIEEAFATRTLKRRKTSWRHWADYCNSCEIKVEDVTRMTKERERSRLLCAFLQWVYSRPGKTIKPETALQYVNDVRFLLKRHYDLDMGPNEEAKRLTKGLAKHRLARYGGDPPSKRHPITIDHLKWWVSHLPEGFGRDVQVSRTTFIAAASMLLMSQYRGGEVFHPGYGVKFNRHLHLSWGDVSLRDDQGTALPYRNARPETVRPGWALALRNPVTKTDQLRAEFADEPVLLPFSMNSYNAAAWLNWLALERFAEGEVIKEEPLFTDGRGHWLARDVMSRLVKEATEIYAKAKGVSLRGVSYGLHSFRIGGGSAMANTGASDTAESESPQVGFFVAGIRKIPVSAIEAGAA